MIRRFAFALCVLSAPAFAGDVACPDMTAAVQVGACPTEEELTAAKANIVGGFALQLDSSKKLTGQLATIGFYGLPLDWLDKYQERMNKVTVAEVKAAFARHVQEDRLSTVLVAAD